MSNRPPEPISKMTIDPDLGRIEPGHVCKHGVRWPHPCEQCDEAAWALHAGAAAADHDDVEEPMRTIPDAALLPLLPPDMRPHFGPSFDLAAQPSRTAIVVFRQSGGQIAEVLADMPDAPAADGRVERYGRRPIGFRCSRCGELGPLTQRCPCLDAA
jgi:hypothetical protein